MTENAMPQMIADVTAERDRLRFPAFILRVLEYALVLTVLTAAALATLYLA